MDQEGRLFVGHFHAVVQGTGHRPCYHTAQGTGGKDDDAQQPGKEFCRPGGPDDALLLYHDIHEAFNAAGAFNEIEHGANQEHGHDDDGIGITGKGFYNAVKRGVQASKKSARQDEVGQKDTDQQGHKHVFEYQRQNNSNQRGND